MAVVSGWWPSVNGDRKYYIDQQAAVNAQIYSNGVLPVGDQFQVLVTEGFGIKVTPGYAWLNGYWILNDADYAMTLDAPDGVMHRVDSVMLQWNRANRETTITIVKGVYGSAPTATAPQRNADVYELCIAQIYVEAGATSITQADITDTRPNSTLCGLSSVYDPPQSDAWFAQFNAGYREWLQNATDEYNLWIHGATTEYNEWIAIQQDDFNNWYNGLKYLLEDEVAVQLSNRIDNVASEVASEVARFDRQYAELASEVDANAESINSIVGLPSVKSEDNGKFLRVVSGAWAAVAMPDAEGVRF